MIITYRKMNGVMMTMDGVAEIEIVLNEAEAQKRQVFKVHGLSRNQERGGYNGDDAVLNVRVLDGTLGIDPISTNSIDLTEKRYSAVV